MRGKGFVVLLAQVCEGITPAYAGKSLPGILTCTMSRDHPRVCGEKEPDAPERASCLGSPPRMRGKESARAAEIHPIRITPAYAGKS